MTDLDRLRIEQTAAREKLEELDAKIAAVESNRSIEKARKAFQVLGTDDTLPALKIVEQALQSWSQSQTGRRPVGPSDASEFIDRLATTINAYSPR